MEKQHMMCRRTDANRLENRSEEAAPERQEQIS